MKPDEVLPLKQSTYLTLHYSADRIKRTLKVIWVRFVLLGHIRIAVHIIIVKRNNNSGPRVHIRFQFIAA